MADLHLPMPAGMTDDRLVAYLNEHIDDVRHTFNLDLSWAYARATVDAVRITGATRHDGELRIEYEYDYSAYCACKDLDARDTLADSTTCPVTNGSIVLSEFTPPVRSTLDEF